MRDEPEECLLRRLPICVLTTNFVVFVDMLLSCLTYISDNAKVELRLLAIINRKRNWHILTHLMAVYLISTEIVYLKSRKPDSLSY